MTAPAVAPIAASRAVFLRVSVRTGAGAEYVPPPEDVPLLEARRVVVVRGAVVVRRGATGARVTVGLVAASAAFRSTIEMLSMPGAYASPARRRSLSRAASTLFESSRPHAAANRIAGMITSALILLIMSTSAD